jgi:hypothetical protein
MSKHREHPIAAFPYLLHAPFVLYADTRKIAESHAKENARGLPTPSRPCLGTYFSHARCLTRAARTLSTYSSSARTASDARTDLAIRLIWVSE